jgi:hypothetical protein
MPLEVLLMVIALLMRMRLLRLLIVSLEYCILHILDSVELTGLRIGKIDFYSGINSQALYPYHNITEYHLFLCKILMAVAIFDNLEVM